MSQSIITADRDLEAVVEDLYADASGDAWQASLRAELPWVGIAEESGGVGGTVCDQVAIARAIGRHGVAAPVVETHLAAFVLARYGESFPHQAMTLTLGDRRDRLSFEGDTVSGELVAVPWAPAAARVVAVVPDPTGALVTCVAEAADVETDDGTDLAGMPLSRVTVRTARVLGALPAGLVPSPRHALLRAAQLAGAVEGASELTRRYVWTREQFGKPLGSFQAVQAHLVTLEQAAVATRLVVQQAAHALEVQGEDEARFEAGASYLVVDEHARLAAAAAHQAHGAIGMTQEYPLARLTRRINAWRGIGARHAVGSEHLGRDALAHASVAHLVRRETPLTEDATV